MQNGITRLYKAIWYTQLGSALEQIDRENIEKTHDIITDVPNGQQDNDQRSKKENRLFDSSEFLQDPNVRNKTSRMVAQKVLTENLDAVRQAYEDIINSKRDNIPRYKKVIGELIALVEQKKNSLKSRIDDLDKLEQNKEAATAESKNISLKLKEDGLSDTEIEQHPDYTQCLNAYNDFDTSVKEKKVRITELEDDIKRAQADFEKYKDQFTQLHRDIAKIETEQSETIEALITVCRKEKINEILSDITS